MPSIALRPVEVASSRRGPGDRETTSAELIRESKAVASAVGAERSHKWHFRTVEAYQSSSIEGMPFAVYLIARLELNDAQRRRLAERADLRYLLSYADPTGETAIRNVMRERGGVRS